MTRSDESVSRLRRERDAARATIDTIMGAIHGDRFRDNLNQCAEDYVRYVLGTAGHLYNVQGYMEVCEEMRRYRAALERVESHGSGEAVRIAREALSR